MQGLRLTLGGAPASPHVVQGVPGLYRPDAPTPVGGEGELSLEEAKRLDADAGVPLELVTIKKADEEAVRARVAADLDATRSGIAVMAQLGPEGAEPEALQDQAAAVAPGAKSAAASGTDEEG